MAREKRSEIKPIQTPNWMVTFGDMNTLLLVFFIALIADAAIENREIRLIFSSLRGSTGVLRGGNTFDEGQLSGGGGTIESLPSEFKGTTIRELPSLVSSKLNAELADGSAKAETEKGKFRLLLSSDRFFRPGSADISGDVAKSILDKLGEALAKLGPGARITVIGHTDDSQIPKESVMSRIYPSNWELSGARAAAFVRALSRRGVVESAMTASGKADTEPIGDNGSAQGKERNRRIEIVVVPPEGK